MIDSPEKWVDEFGDYLYGFALNRTKDTHLAEDLVQETFLAALKGRNSFQGKSTIKTWLIGILKRKIVDNFRKDSKYVGMDHDKFEETFSFFQQEGGMKGQWNEKFAPLYWENSPAKEYENNELMNVLKYCISKMPKNLSSIFVVKEIDGMESKDICKEFEISPSNLWVILHRARLLMRGCVEKNWFIKEF